MQIYLDNNATTQPAPEVVAAMNEVNTTLWGNPSSVHRFGQAARQRVELARAAVAKLLNCRERELIFTSGGTEANNLALRGVLLPGADATPSPNAAPPRLITTRVEHSAIRAPAEFLGSQNVEVTFLPLNRDGVVSLRSLEAALSGTNSEPGRAAPIFSSPILLSIQWANNETGVIQPIAEIAALLRGLREAPNSALRGRLLFHVDATQAVGKLPVDVREAGVDLLSFAAHKFHGPKGVGGLFVRTGIRLRAQQLGGPQERDRRGGTENTAGIIGMGVAAELAQTFLTDTKRFDELTAMRDRFERAILAALPDTVVNSKGAPRLWNTTNLGFPRLEAEAILLGLSERGLSASAGAACSSGSLEPSPVLLAMGIPEEIAHGSVRFSLSRFTTAGEIEQACEIVPMVVRKLAQTLPTNV